MRQSDFTQFLIMFYMFEGWANENSTKLFTLEALGFNQSRKDEG
jgi:hypothetical protein